MVKKIHFEVVNMVDKTSFIFPSLLCVVLISNVIYIIIAFPKPFQVHKDQENVSRSAKNNVILFWTPYFGKKDFAFGFGQEVFEKTGCEFTNCETTADKNRLNESDVLIFHMREGLKYKGLPKHRFLHQRWTAFSRESPAYQSGSPIDSLNGVMNWTMTYRRDSDVLACYNFFRPSNDPNRTEELKINRAANKTKFVAWVASNCGAVSQRMKYVKELKKHIPIDIYGRCGTKKIPMSCKHDSKCYDPLGKMFKFYLSFENCMCHDFMTNKINNAMNNSMIPIVLGVPNYSELLPSHSYIDVKSFSSPKKLAEYLYILDKNETLYNEYFTWKSKVKLFDARDIFCTLCKTVNQITPPKTYYNLVKWWHDGMCTSPETFYKGIL